MQVIHADIVYSEDREHLAVHPDSYIAVEKGVVKGIWPVLPEEYRKCSSDRLRGRSAHPCLFGSSCTRTAVSEQRARNGPSACGLAG